MHEDQDAPASKVPEVTVMFWVIKILATTLGETAGDAVSADNAGDRCAATVELNRGVAGQRQYERRCYRNQQGVVTTEHWLVKGAGHAWFGGDISGTFVDSAGPDASREMVRFFMQHPHKDKQNG